MADAATSERAVAVATTLTEMYAAHTYQMVTPITGNTVDRGIISGTTRLGLWTTGLGSIGVWATVGLGPASMVGSIIPPKKISLENSSLAAMT